MNIHNSTLKFHTSLWHKTNFLWRYWELRKLIKRLAEYISERNQYNSDEREQIEYSMRVFIFETLKIACVIIFFSLIGYTIQAIIAITTMVTIKPFIGGYHEDTQIKCFIATLIIIGSVIYLSNHVNINLISCFILEGISFYCIWQQAPIINPKMILTRVDLIQRNRKVGLSIIVLYILLSTIFYKYTTTCRIVCWTLVFQALLMFNKKI